MIVYEHPWDSSSQVCLVEACMDAFLNFYHLIVILLFIIFDLIGYVGYI